ncbi:SseB family protein [Actinocatenispora sera]|uniref:SseB protein N-terminal domain-containing protein n=1 Tax=Actinocatenispora sera TaxID=390989 RepID=A0A810KWU4_9ACTN|nr:SseB family protein [Actinocatenispora sera]BCJ27683.1 hypothetical protein Asera_17910 [Actinocatenispora sera]
MADEWQPANDVERSLLDAMQRGEQDRYFEVLGAADLILPFAADATGAAQPGTWATWGYEGRTYILAFTSQPALASIMGRPTDQFRTGRLAEVCAWWPDESWWLAVDFGLPIAGYLPGTFVSQLTGVQLGAQLAVGGASADPAATYRPGEQDGAGQPDPLQTQQTPTPPADPGQTVAVAPADPGQTVAAAPADPGDGAQHDAAAQPSSGQPYQQPTSAQPYEQSASAQPTSAQPYQQSASAQPTSAQPYQQGAAQPYQAAGAQPYEPGREQAYPPADAAAQYQQQAGAASHAGAAEQQAQPPAAGASPGTVPVLSTGAADAAGFQPASPLEQTLLDASRTGDRKTFMDALLGAYLLVPVPEGAAPGPTAVTAPDFPWPSIERNGTPQVPVFTSQERMRERVGAAPYAVVPFVLIVEHWPHREWYLALNPDTPVSATVDGDQIAELAEWARRTHLAERLGVLPPQQSQQAEQPQQAEPGQQGQGQQAEQPYQPERGPLVPAQSAPVSAQPASDRPASEQLAGTADASPWSAPADAAAHGEELPARPDGAQAPHGASPAADSDAAPGGHHAADERASEHAAAGGHDGSERDAETPATETGPGQPAATGDDAADSAGTGAGDEAVSSAVTGDGDEAPGSAGTGAGDDAVPAEGAEDVRGTAAGTVADLDDGARSAAAEEGPSPVEAEQDSSPDLAETDATTDESAVASDAPPSGSAVGSDAAAGGSAVGSDAVAGGSAVGGSAVGNDVPTTQPAVGDDAPASGSERDADAVTGGAAVTGESRTGAEALTGEPESGDDAAAEGLAPGTVGAAAGTDGGAAVGTATPAAAGAGAASRDPATGAAADAPPQDDGEPAPEWPPVPPALENEPTPTEPVPPLSFPALLQKVLPDAQVPFYLERHFDRVGGWIHPVADAPVRAGDLRVATGLSAEVAAEPVHAIRWHVEAEQLLPVLAAVRSAADPELVEYRVPTARLPHGAELYRIDPDGATTVLAVFNADHHRWHPLI